MEAIATFILQIVGCLFVLLILAHLGAMALAFVLPFIFVLIGLGVGIALAILGYPATAVLVGLVIAIGGTAAWIESALHEKIQDVLGSMAD